jgi:hypothetical protein
MDDAIPCVCDYELQVVGINKNNFFSSSLLSTLTTPPPLEESMFRWKDSNCNHWQLLLRLDIPIQHHARYLLLQLVLLPEAGSGGVKQDDE